MILKQSLCCTPVIIQCLFLFHPTIVTCPRPKGYVCPQNISIGWMETPPYVYRNEADESVVGPLVNILRDALDDCCLNNITLDFIERHSEYSELVEHSLNSSYDMVLPIVSDIGKDKFLAFPYVLLGMYLHSTGAHIHANATIKQVIVHLDLRCKDYTYTLVKYHQKTNKILTFIYISSCLTSLLV